MREIQASQITDAVERLCIEANEHLPEDVKEAIKGCRACEDWDIAKGVLDNIIENCGVAYHSDEHNVGLIYGDYFFIEAIFKLLGKGEFLW